MNGGEHVVPEQGGGWSPLMGELRSMWQDADPVPSDLVERVQFALDVAEFTATDLDVELLRLQQAESVGAGARGEDVRTVTFGSDAMTVMLAICQVAGGHRVDGWVAPGGRRRIEVHTSSGSSEELADETGRFTLPFVPAGHFQLVLAADADGESLLDGPATVVTPALTL